jgi:DNA-binding IclR family transcriptional regulator
MNAASLETDLARLRSEYRLYPGMCLTIEQVARLLDVPRDEAAGLLATLESEGLLFHWSHDGYRLALPLLS